MGLYKFEFESNTGRLVTHCQWAAFSGGIIVIAIVVVGLFIVRDYCELLCDQERLFFIRERLPLGRK